MALCKSLFWVTLAALTHLILHNNLCRSLLLSFLIVEGTEAWGFVVIWLEFCGLQNDEVWLQSLCPEPGLPCASVSWASHYGNSRSTSLPWVFKGSDTFGSSSKCTLGQSKACRRSGAAGFLILTSAIWSGGGHQEVRLERTIFFGAKTPSFSKLFIEFLKGTRYCVRYWRGIQVKTKCWP